jgi:hypothetical protein
VVSSLLGQADHPGLSSFVHGFVGSWQGGLLFDLLPVSETLWNKSEWIGVLLWNTMRKAMELVAIAAMGIAVMQRRLGYSGASLEMAHGVMVAIAAMTFWTAKASSKTKFLGLFRKYYVRLKEHFNFHVFTGSIVLGEEETVC